MEQISDAEAETQATDEHDEVCPLCGPLVQRTGRTFRHYHVTDCGSPINAHLCGQDIGTDGRVAWELWYLEGYRAEGYAREVAEYLVRDQGAVSFEATERALYIRLDYVPELCRVCQRKGDERCAGLAEAMARRKRCPSFKPNNPPDYCQGNTGEYCRQCPGNPFPGDIPEACTGPQPQKVGKDTGKLDRMVAGSEEDFTCDCCGEHFKSGDVSNIIRPLCEPCREQRRRSLYPVGSAITAAVSQLNRDHQMADLAGERPACTYEDLALLLEHEASEVRKIEGHAHDWNDDDYCNICGADGRA